MGGINCMRLLWCSRKLCLAPLLNRISGTFQEFIDDLQGAVILVDPSPDVMRRAALLKDLPYKRGTSKGRRLSTTDAIMLASCIEIRDSWGVSIDAFHTFDDGKKSGLEGKMVPLISYDKWCEGFTAEQLKIAEPAMQLNRCKPEHSEPDFSQLLEL